MLMALVAIAATAAPLKVTVKDINVERSESSLLLGMNVDATGLKLASNKEIRYIPVVSNGDSVAYLPAIVFAGRNRLIQNERQETPRKEGVTLSKAGKTVDYSAVIPFEAWMENSTLSLVEDECNCGVNTNGDGEDNLPTGIAKLNFARPAFIPQFTFVTPPAEIKTATAHGEAYIDFPVNKTEIYPDYRRNPEELAKIRATIDQVHNDPDSKVTGITITGYASPEGSYAVNERLAKGRAEALVEYVRSLYSFNPKMMHADWVAENWEGLRKYVENSNLDNRKAILSIINDKDLEPDARERKLKADFPTQYKFLLENVYPGLRRSDYEVNYEIRRFTSVDEIKQVMATDPRKLDLHEIYVVANTLEPGSDEYREAFELAVRLFPDNQDANLNMAAVALMRNELSQAAGYLAKAGDSPRAVYARGVLAYKEGDVKKGKVLIQQAADSGLAEAKQAIEQIKLVESDQGNFTIIDVDR